MSGINWGLGQQGGVQNALAMGMSMGQQAREARERKERRNALATYAANPTKEGVAGLAQYAPEFAMQEGQRFRAEEAAQQQKQQADMGTVRKLLRFAKANPMQALQAAQQMGIDVSKLPQPSDPNFQGWVDQQLFITDALERPEGVEALSTAGKIAADMGFKPGTPEHADRTREIFLAESAKPYTNAQGGTSLYIPQLGGSGQYTAPTPGTVVGGYRFKGGDPKVRDNWEQGGPSQPATGGF